jgi:hypothetical protein
VINGNVTFKELPKGAMGLAGLGLLLLVWALLNMGDRITTYNVTQLNLADASFVETPADESLVRSALTAYAAWGDGQITAPALAALEGTWASRWRRHDEAWHHGTASATQSGYTLRFVYREAGTVWDVDARYVEPGVLFGPWRNRDTPADAGHWIGFVTPQGDIRGYYDNGEWHFWRP